MRRLLAVVGWGLAAVFALSTYFLWRYAWKRETAPPVTVESAPVVLAIQKIAKLATVEIQVADVVRYQQVKSFLIFDFPKSAVLRLRGRVLGGFNLDTGEFQVTPDPANRRLAIRMPPPRILSIDPRFDWFDEQSGMFNPITPEDRNRWMIWARGALGRSARQAGLDAMARDQAKKLLEGAAEALGWKAEVSFAATPAQVNPEFPQ